MNRNLGFWIFIFFLSLYTLTMSGHMYGTDDAVKLGVTQSILERGTISIEGLNLWCFPYSAWPIGHSIALIPFYSFGSAISKFIPYFPKSYITEFCASWYNVLICSLLCLFSFIFLLHLGYSKKAAVLTTFTIGLTTTIWPYSKQGWSEPTVALLLLVSIISLSLWQNKRKTKSLVLSALFFGIASLFRPEVIIIGLIFVLFIILHFRSINFKSLMKHLLLFVFIVFILYSINLAYNYARYGSLFDTGYGYYEKVVKRISFIPSLGHFIQNLCRRLFSLNKSIFLYSPPIILAFLSFRSFFRKNKSIALILLSVVSIVFIFLTYGALSSWAWGPRYTVYIVPLIALFLAPLWAKRTIIKRSLVALCIIGFMIQVIGISVSYMVVNEKVFGEEGEKPLIDSWSQVFPEPSHSMLCLAPKEFVHYAIFRGLNKENNPSDELVRMNTFDFWFLLAYFKGVPIKIILPVILLLFFLVGFSLAKIWILSKTNQQLKTIN